MLQITRIKGENIDRILKRYKSKVSSTKLVKKIRSLMFYAKPAVTRKAMKSRGKYRASLISKLNNE